MFRQIPQSNEPPKVPEITVKEVHEKIKNSSQFKFIDVRTNEEFNKEHILGIEHREQNPDTHAINCDGLNKDDEIIVSCQSGRRSAWVTDYLQKMDFINVKSMKGGINDWIKKGYEVERGVLLNPMRPTGL